MVRTMMCRHTLALVVCGFAVSPGLLAAPWRDVLNLEVNESDGIQRAARVADTAALRAIGTSASVDAERSLAMAMLYRVTGEPERSDALARQCVAEAEKGSQAVQAISGFLCSEVLAGNRFLARDYPAWGQALVTGVTTTRKPFDERYGTQPYRFASLNGLDPIAISRLPKLSSPRPPAPGTVLSRLYPTFDDGKKELRYDTSGAAPPWVTKMTVNGMPVAMRVDTGAIVTNLNRDSAERAKVRIVAPTFLPLGVGASGAIMSSSLGEMDALSAETLKASPWRVAVSDAPDVLGSDFLRFLRVFRVDENRLTVLAAADARRCKYRLLLASDWQGQHVLVTLLPIDGVEQRVMVDTGDDGPLSVFEPGSATAEDPTLTIRSLSGPRTLHFRAGTANVAGHKVTVRHIAGESQFPFNQVIGAGALRDISLTIDFDAMHLCIDDAGRTSL